MNMTIKPELQINSLSCASPSQISIRPQLLDHHSLPRYPLTKKSFFKIFVANYFLNQTVVAALLKLSFSVWWGNLRPRLINLKQLHI